MEAISLFAGIGGFEEALRRADVRCVASVEIDRAAQSVLRRQFPDTEIYKDVKGYHPNRTVGLICGGPPCQDFSIAGRRKGLAGERSGLWFEFLRVVKETHPGWVVVENVPGMLSSCGCPTCGAMRRLLKIHGYLRRRRHIHQPCPICHAAQRLLKSHRGRDFAIIIRGLAECGYGVAWRILDAQYFGVAQRRRRVYIVGHLGDGRAAQVLFESEGVSWDTPPRHGAGQEVAATIRGRSKGNSHEPGRGGEDDYNLVSHALTGSKTATGRLDPNGQDFVVAGSLDRKSCASNRGSQANEADFLVAGTLPADYAKQGGNGMGEMRNGIIAYNIQHNDGGEHKRKDRPNGGMYVNETDTALTVGTTDLTAIAWEMSHASEAVRENGNVAPTLQRRMGTGGNQIPLVGVRRLTPTECERLQGFQDGWTQYGVDESGRVVEQSDSARYRQLGNAVAVPVAEWIIRRIVKVDQNP